MPSQDFAERHPLIATNLAIVWATVVVLILVAVGSIAWLAWGGTVEKKHLDIENHNYRNTYGYQQTLIDTIDNELPQALDPDASPGQVKAITADICNRADQLSTDIPGNIADFTQEHCQP